MWDSGGRTIVVKRAPTCFGPHRIHHQRALYRAWLKIARIVLSCPLTWTRSVLWQHIVTGCVCSSLYMNIILMVSTHYILCISWIIKCLSLTHGANIKICDFYYLGSEFEFRMTRWIVWQRVDLLFFQFLRERLGKCHKLDHNCFNIISESLFTVMVIRVRWVGHVARMGERRVSYRASVGKTEGTRLLGRPRLTWQDNIKMDLKK